MHIDLPGSVEDELRSLAEKQGRDVRALAEEAIRQYCPPSPGGPPGWGGTMTIGSFGY